jgi:outer membrane protein assembly factor BamB
MISLRSVLAEMNKSAVRLMRFRGLLAAVGVAAAAWLYATVALAATPGRDWPSFRGANRTGVSTDTGLLQEWPKDGPPLLWESTGAGRGYASLAIVGDRIYTLGDAPTGADDEDEYLLCINRENGSPLWKLKTGGAWKDGKPDWQSSRSTPTVDGELVYALTAHGELICCESATGKERWRKNLKSDFDGKKGDSWGYSESVLIDGDKLICTPGGEKSTMVALNKQTGELLWNVSRPEDRGAGHASIVIAEIGGARVYVQTTASGPLGVRASDGKLLWSYPIEKTTAVIPTPIVRGDLVFFAAGYKRGGALLKQVAEPDGEVKIEEIYGLKKELANKHGGIVLVGDYLFGDSDDAGIPFCAELMSGEIKWKSRASGSGSAAFAAADGCVYIHFANGNMSLVKAVPDGFAEVGSFKVPGSGDRPSWSHPVIVGGLLYLREQDHILCYDVRAAR